MKRIIWLGTMRSGHHAIMNWFLTGCEGPVYHRDNITHPLKGDYKSLINRSELPDIPIRKKLTGSKTVSYAFERAPVLKIKKFMLGMDEPANTRILVLRDPWNQFASHLKLIESGKAKFTDVNLIPMVWVKYVRFAIRHKFDIIHFNEWVTDESYREELIEKYSITPVFNSHIKTSIQGGGSSFGKKVHRDKLKNRWRLYEDNEDWQAMTSHKTVKTLAKMFWDGPEFL